MSDRTVRARDRRLLVATALVVPAFVFVAANVLEHELGVAGAAAWLDPALGSRMGWLVTGLVVTGPPAALLIAATRFLPIRLVRDGEAWEVRIRVRPDGWAVAVATVSVALGGVLASHLILENLPCVARVAERC